jgi:hypothetical protein
MTFNMTNEITAEIRQLRYEARLIGDLRQAMICALALEGSDALDGAEPGTEAAILQDEGRTVEWARKACADAIRAAAAEVR